LRRIVARGSTYCRRRSAAEAFVAGSRAAFPTGFMPIAGLLASGLTPSTLFAGEAGHGPALGAQLHVATLVPFALLLLAIAVLPLAAGHWWEHNKNKGIVAALLAAPVAIYLLTFGDAGKHALGETVLEFASFIVLLGSLFLISGGIYVQGSLSGTPLINTAILGLGAVIANFVGTTGASVLLIRPLLRANAPRERKVHVVVFFIFIVSNCGGLLTPLGDPPLFMGFLRGVPFEWTFQLWKEWLLAMAYCLCCSTSGIRLCSIARSERPGLNSAG
jgi:Na+/H+ antiporter NhaD/arsenite permease-like protein